MKAFTQHTGLVCPLDRANVDTDQIIPKQFLKSIKRTGFGPSSNPSNAPALARICLMNGGIWMSANRGRTTASVRSTPISY